MFTENSTALESYFEGLEGWTQEERDLINEKGMDMNIFADRLFEIVEASPPILNREQIEDVEDAFQSGQRTRRAALLFASMTGKEMVNKAINDRDFAVIMSGIADELTNLQAMYRDMADLLGSVRARVLVALASREDMQQVIEEGPSIYS